MAVNTKNDAIRAVGRRKTSAARVRLEKGNGTVVVNNKDIKEYFPTVFWQNKVIAPLEVVGKEKEFNISARVLGGGVNSQAEAVRHGVARALIKLDEALKPVLKAEGFLTRDPRVKERKKPGKRRARRTQQWRKR
jgi:small subunit ribosomal protein S9